MHAMYNHRKWLLMFPVLFLSFCSDLVSNDAAGNVSVTLTQSPDPVPTAPCSNVTLSCTASLTQYDVTDLWWSVDSHNVTDSATKISHKISNDSVTSEYSVECVDPGDRAVYTCHVTTNVSRSTQLRLFSAPSLLSSSGARVTPGQSAVLTCLFSGDASLAPNITWWRDGELVNTVTNSSAAGSDDLPQWPVLYNTVLDTALESRLVLDNVTRQDNGTLQCRAGSSTSAAANVSLTVIEVPKLSNLSAVAVGKSHLYVTWEANTGNAPIINYTLEYRKVDNVSSPSGWLHVVPVVDTTELSGVITGLAPNSRYAVRVRAANEAGFGNSVVFGDVGSDRVVKTSAADPLYQPSLSLQAATSESLTVSWDAPPDNETQFVHYYRLVRADQNSASGQVVESDTSAESRVFVWRGLDAGRLYTMSVRSCNRHVQLCGLWSTGINGTTLLDHSAVPRDLTLQCQLDHQSPHLGRILVMWSPPLSLSKVAQYSVQVSGKAQYTGKAGSLDEMYFGPEFRSLPIDQTQAIFTVPPNTNYTVEVCALSASSRCRGVKSDSCRLGAGVPALHHLPPFSWWRVQQQYGWTFLLQVDRVDERNGPVCCYRVVLVRLQHDQLVSNLSEPDSQPLLTYEQVQKQGYGAYIADTFQHDFVETRYITLGDDNTLASTFSDSDSCSTCHSPATPAPPTSSGAPSTTSISTETNDPNAAVSRQSRAAGNVTGSEVRSQLRDGPLHLYDRYTAFVQFIVRRGDGEVTILSTDYLPALTPAPPSSLGSGRTMAVLLGVTCALAFCVLLLVLTLCVLRHHGKEVSVTGAVRLMLENFRGEALTPAPAPDLPPLARDQLVSTYLERHADADLGFRREFECLPQYFPDRTTFASEALENHKKNRYPDIRAYDQTRVKLSQRNNVQSTDYINANYVCGYKERKKFICAQGPLEATIDDFWRMVWEQGCELMVMLTNLEEVGRNKCAKYWPDQGESVYGSITVSLADEKAFSDYIQRVLSVSFSRSDGTNEIRRITHLHYLVWKDFMAPEHPTGLLRFIRRINEIYSLEMGPILVHCSAGVGRTGTLVAIDSMLQQMNEEGEVTVFNTICDLRYQRNYLVQSLKQYVFVYRALMEMAQFGDTQVEATKLALTYKSLCAKSVKDKSRTKLADEFRRLGDVVEERKSFVVGSSDENRVKNRYDYVVPYDSNRVILAPISSRPTDTYINASFIQGYDISETYVITQHPLQSTQADFWRMVFDLEVPAIIMLSQEEESVVSVDASAEAASDCSASGGEIANDTGCVVYWPAVDSDTMFDHFSVRCSSEQSVSSCLHIRHLTVTNTKTQESISVQLMKFSGWTDSVPPELESPQSAEGGAAEAPSDAALPQSVAPLVTLMTRCVGARETASGPVVVHCSDGGFRSSVLVSLFILLRQLDTERCVDVFQTVRKLRSQRQSMVQHLSQYDFLYRALIEYLTLSSSGSSAVPVGNGHAVC